MTNLTPMLKVISGRQLSRFKLKKIKEKNILRGEDKILITRGESNLVYDLDGRLIEKRTERFYQYPSGFPYFEPCGRTTITTVRYEPTGRFFGELTERVSFS